MNAHTAAGACQWCSHTYHAFDATHVRARQSMTYVGAMKPYAENLIEPLRGSRSRTLSYADAPSPLGGGGGGAV